MQVRTAYDIFMLSGVLEELGIPESELTGFLSAVSAHYHKPEDVPYHNLSHVVQVLHAVWLVSAAAEALRRMTCGEAGGLAAAAAIPACEPPRKGPLICGLCICLGRCTP
jgi:hypothetical protein